MTWNNEGSIWTCTVHGIPIAVVVRLRMGLFAFKCIGPTGLITEGRYENYTHTKTIADVEATLHDMGW